MTVGFKLFYIIFSTEGHIRCEYYLAVLVRSNLLNKSVRGNNAAIAGDKLNSYEKPEPNTQYLAVIPYAEIRVLFRLFFKGYFGLLTFVMYFGVYRSCRNRNLGRLSA